MPSGAIDDGRARVARRAPHQPGDRGVEAEPDREQHVDREVDPEDLQRCERAAVRDVEDAGADEGEDEAAQHDQLDAHVLHQVVVDPATALDRGHDRREVVVGQDHVAGFLRHLGARDPHRDADVGPLQGRRVVDPVARHRDDVADSPSAARPGAPCPRGRRAPRRRSRRAARSSSSSESAANSVPVSARPSIPSWAAMAAAVVAWSPVIMRARIPASLQCAIASPASLRGGSTMPDEREQRQPLHLVEERALGMEVRRLEVAGGDGEHAEALAGEPVVLGEDALPARRRRGIADAVRIADVRRAREEHVGRSLDEAAHDRAARLLHLVEGRHQLVLGVERHLCRPADTRVSCRRRRRHPSPRGRRAPPPSGRRRSRRRAPRRRSRAPSAAGTGRAACRSRRQRAGSCRSVEYPSPSIE